MVFADASPIEHAKYPSDQKVCSFQNCFLKNILCFFHIAIVDLLFNIFTIELTDSLGTKDISKCMC